MRCRVRDRVRYGERGRGRRDLMLYAAPAIAAAWTEWSAIAFAGVFGLYLEKNGNKLVKTLSAPLLATLMGLLLTNMGLTPSSSTVYDVVNKFLGCFVVINLLFPPSISSLNHCFTLQSRSLSIKHKNWLDTKEK